MGAGSTRGAGTEPAGAPSAGKAPTPPAWQVAGLRVTVRRSARRRTLALQVRGGQITAYAPASLPDAAILAFVEAKQGWLREHLREQLSQPGPEPLSEGSVWPFLGEALRVRWAPAGKERAWREGGVLYLPRQGAEAAASDWARRAAERPFAELVRHYAAELGAGERLRRVIVSGTQTRWGSCSAAGDIRLHWALSRAPLEVLRYVALHEAAHLLELNHSARYWAHVARVMPDHQRHRAWLREHGAQLQALAAVPPFAG